MKTLSILGAIVALLASLLLAGCGGGGSSQPMPQAPPITVDNGFSEVLGEPVQFDFTVENTTALPMQNVVLRTYWNTFDDDTSAIVEVAYNKELLQFKAAANAYASKDWKRGSVTMDGVELKAAGDVLFGTQDGYTIPLLKAHQRVYFQVTLEAAQGGDLVIEGEATELDPADNYPGNMVLHITVENKSDFATEAAIFTDRRFVTGIGQTQVVQAETRFNYRTAVVEGDSLEGATYKMGASSLSWPPNHIVPLGSQGDLLVGKGYLITLQPHQTKFFALWYQK